MKDQEYLLNLLESAQEKVPISSKWRHYKGHEYEIKNIALDEKELFPVIIYTDSKGLTWSRRMENFLEKVENNGKMSQRFTRL